jgi:xanthosine utilization system XapX-like protein
VWRNLPPAFVYICARPTPGPPVIDLVGLFGTLPGPLLLGVVSIMLPPSPDC